MNLREEARKAGGDELVADLDWARGIEREASSAFQSAIDGIIATYPGDTDRRNAFVTAALAEAMSAIFAKQAVLAAGASAKMHGEEFDRTTALAMALRSVAGGLDKAFDDVEAEKAGVADLIMGAAQKGEAK